MDQEYLLRRNIIPPVESELPSKSTRFPTWYYKLNKEKNIEKDFEVFVREIIKRSIQKQPIDHGQLWEEVSGTKIKIKSWGIEEWITGTLGGEEVECTEDYFYSPPWLVFPYISPSPSKEKAEILLKACKTCLTARKEGKDVLYVGILFPLQKTGIWYDVSSWDSDKFENLLNLQVSWGQFEPKHLPFEGNYGRHISKGEVLQKDFSFYKRPLQIFLTSPQGRIKIKEGELEQIKNNTSSCTLFVHGRYIYNLCTDDPWISNGIIEEIKAGEKIGARGVVVHVGKSKDNNLREAMSIMEKNIRKVLEEVTTCPLLLETCAGQGSEVLAHPDEFIEFYNLFDENKLKICVDSAHCHGAGYHTPYFLQLLEENKPGSVALVHFNDSKVPLGARKDRHEIPGLGHIGYERMEELHGYCIEKRIPMIFE